MEAKDFIDQTVKQHPVVLFMKGTAQFPQCGFSGKAVQMLKSAGVKNMVTVNVLEDDDVRQAIKDYSSWPTIPQLYVKGEFVGGSWASGTRPRARDLPGWRPAASGPVGCGRGRVGRDRAGTGVICVRADRGGRARTRR